MKRILILAILVATPALFAAETNAPAPTLLTNVTPALQVNIAEQAELIQQIGEDAARDFDVEAHARSLRVQIESLVTKPVTAKPTAPTSAVENTTQQPESADEPSAAAAPATATKANSNMRTKEADPAVLREAVVVLRRAANELEARIESSAKN